MNEAELKTEQRCAVHFCFRLGKTTTETLLMLQQAYGESCMTARTIYRWYQNANFKAGRQSVELIPKSAGKVMLIVFFDKLCTNTPYLVNRVHSKVELLTPGTTSAC
jgi:hypothetical protein